MIIIMFHTIGFIIDIKGKDYLMNLYPKGKPMETKSGIKYYIIVEDEQPINEAEIK